MLTVEQRLIEAEISLANITNKIKRFLPSDEEIEAVRTNVARNIRDLKLSIRAAENIITQLSARIRNA